MEPCAHGLQRIGHTFDRRNLQALQAELAFTDTADTGLWCMRCICLRSSSGWSLRNGFCSSILKPGVTSKVGHTNMHSMSEERWRNLVNYAVMQKTKTRQGNWKSGDRIRMAIGMAKCVVGRHDIANGG